MKKMIIPVIIFALHISSSCFARELLSIDAAISNTMSLIETKSQDIKENLSIIRDNLSKDIEKLREQVEEYTSFFNRLKERGITKWKEPKLKNQMKNLEICIGTMTKTLENWRRQLTEIDSVLNKTAKRKKQETLKIG